MLWTYYYNLQLNDLSRNSCNGIPIGILIFNPSVLNVYDFARVEVVRFKIFLFIIFYQNPLLQTCLLVVQLCQTTKTSVAENCTPFFIMSSQFNSHDPRRYITPSPLTFSPERVCHVKSSFFYDYKILNFHTGEHSKYVWWDGVHGYNEIERDRDCRFE